MVLHSRRSRWSNRWIALVRNNHRRCFIVTLTYGLKRPQTGDQGAALFTALQDNITRIDGHDHDGSDSPKLTAASTTTVLQTIASASWVSTSQGNYRQLITLPGTLLMAEISMQFRTSGNHIVFPTIEWVSTTTYYVYTNDNSTLFTAVYSS